MCAEMKITVTLKDPDVLNDAIKDSVKQDVKTMNLPADEAELLIEKRCEKIRASMSKWWEYSEYLTVEFDSDAMTAQVMERR